MHSLSFSGIVHQGGRSVPECGPMVREVRVGGGCGWFVGVHYRKFRSIGVFAYGDRDFRVFGNVLTRCYYLFGRGVCEVVATYVRVSSYFV